MKPQKVTTNRKLTRGRQIYYQPVNQLIPIREQRLVGVNRNWFLRLLVWLRIKKPFNLAVRKKVVIAVLKEKTNRTIKHNLPTRNQTQFAEKFMDISDRKNRHISSSNPKTIAKRNQKHRGILIWDSARQGTFRGSVQQDLIYA